jgi:hypothetical protein
MKSPVEAQRELQRELSDKRRRAASPLKCAYPQVQEVRLDLAFADSLCQAPVAQVRRLYPPARAFFEFPCPHPDCSGQLDLDEIVTNALTTSRRSIRGELVCPGVRPERGATSRNCELRVQYHVTTSYR